MKIDDFHVLLHVQAVGLIDHTLDVANIFLASGNKVTFLIPDSESLRLAVQPRHNSQLSIVRESVFFKNPFVPDVLMAFHPQIGSNVSRLLSNTRCIRIVAQHGLSGKALFASSENASPLRDFDYLFVPGPFFYERATAAYARQAQEQRGLEIILVGQPKADQLLLPPSLTREDFCETYALDGERPIVCYAPTWEKEASLETHGLEIIEALAQLQVNVVIKLHHASTSPFNHDWIVKEGRGTRNWGELLKTLSEKYSNVLHYTNWNGNELLRHTDLLVSDASGIAYEFAVLGKPIIFYDCPAFFEKYGKDEIDYTGRKVGTVCASIDKLCEEVSARVIRRDVKPYTHDQLSFTKSLLSQVGESTLYQYRFIMARLKGEILLEERKRIDTKILFSEKNNPRVSIIIPTFNRCNDLRRCVASILRSCSNLSYEILIVDNNCSDSTAAYLKSIGSQFTNVRAIFEGRQGVHYARNTAASAATGNLLYFIDDDVEVARTTLTALNLFFETNYNIGSMTGPVLPKFEVIPEQHIIQHCMNYLLSLNNLGPDTIVSDTDPGVFSCNMAISRNTFFKTNGFHPENTKGIWIGDGETGLNLRLRDLGLKFAYLGSMLVFHHIPATRLTRNYFQSRFSNQGFCDAFTNYRRTIPDNNKLKEEVLSEIKKLNACIGNYVNTCIENPVLDAGVRDLLLSKCHYHLSGIEYRTQLIVDPNWRSMVTQEKFI